MSINKTHDEINQIKLVLEAVKTSDNEAQISYTIGTDKYETHSTKLLTVSDNSVSIIQVHGLYAKPVSIPLAFIVSINVIFS